MKRLFLIFALYSLANASQAQDLPGVQPSTNINLPADIKIDGKANEWKDQFQAYSTSLNCFYTVANNSEKLYVIIKVKDPLILKKIIGGAITFTVNTSGKRGDENGSTVTFPILSDKAKSAIALAVNTYSSYNLDSPAELRKADSTAMFINQTIVKNAKEIRVLRLKGITDTLISSYNKEGIRSMTIINSKKELTSELVIPMKLISGNISAVKQIAYNIMFNGVEATGVKIVKKFSNPDIASVTAIPRGMLNTSKSANNDLISFPTDMWGIYTIVK